MILTYLLSLSKGLIPSNPTKVTVGMTFKRILPVEFRQKLNVQDWRESLIFLPLEMPIDGSVGGSKRQIIWWDNLESPYSTIDHY